MSYSAAYSFPTRRDKETSIYKKRDRDLKPLGDPVST